MSHVLNLANAVAEASAALAAAIAAEATTAPIPAAFAAPVPVAVPVAVAVPTGNVATGADAYAAFRLAGGVSHKDWNANDTPEVKAAVLALVQGAYDRTTKNVGAACAAFGANLPHAQALGKRIGGTGAPTAKATAAPVAAVAVPSMDLFTWGESVLDAVPAQEDKPAHVLPAGCVALNAAKMVAKAAGWPVPTSGKVLDTIMTPGAYEATKAHVQAVRDDVTQADPTGESVALWMHSQVHAAQVMGRLGHLPLV